MNTQKPLNAFDKYLKRTLNPAATFSSSHQSIQHGETFTTDERSPAKPCRGYEAANGKSPKYTLHLKIVIHEQTAFPAVRWPETCTKPLLGLSSGMCFIAGGGNLHSRSLNLVLPVLTATPCPSEHTARPSARLKGIAGRHLGDEESIILPKAYKSTAQHELTQLRRNKKRGRRRRRPRRQTPPDPSHTTCVPWESGFDAVTVGRRDRVTFHPAEVFTQSPTIRHPPGFK